MSGMEEAEYPLYPLNGPWWPGNVSIRADSRRVTAVDHQVSPLVILRIS